METNKPTFARKCDCCGAGMNEGYLINDGCAYFCSKECLNTEYSEADWKEMYDDGNGSSCYTSWEDEDDFLYVQTDDGEVVAIEDIA